VLLVELAVGAEMLDEEHQDLPQDSTDTGSYSFCPIGEYDVVVACLLFGLV
jgi:hypothetical protein